MNDHRQHWASSDDLRRILGDLDDPKVLEVLDLAPTVAHIEEARRCLAAGNEGKRASAVARRIVDILTSDEDEHLREP